MKVAACYGCEDAIRLILAHGASPDGETGNRQPLELALDRRTDFGTAKLLLGNEANGAFALGNAMDRGDWSVVESISPYVSDYRSAMEMKF